MRRFAFALSTLATMVLVIAVVCSDRWYWSQFIGWIPWFLLAVLAIPGAILAATDRGLTSPRRWLLTAIGCAPLGAVLASEIGWHREPPIGSDEISVIHWNANWPDAAQGSRPSAVLLARRADLVVLSNPYKFFADGRSDEWIAEGYDIVMIGSFGVASRLPILEARAAFAGEDSSAAVVRVDAQRSLGKVLTLLAVDLPSNPWRSRSEIAATFRAELDTATLPRYDLVVGDFNITRGSASIRSMFPGFRDAWSDAGSGRSATWPREWPLWHLDQMLLSPSLVARTYRVFDPLAQHHRAQVARIATRASLEERRVGDHLSVLTSFSHN